MKSKLITTLTDKTATITSSVEIMLPILMLMSVFSESFRFDPPDWLFVLYFTQYRQYPSRVMALSQLHVKSFDLYVTMLFLSGYCCNFCLLRTSTWFPPYQPRSWFQYHVIVVPHTCTSRVPDHSILAFILFYEFRAGQSFLSFRLACCLWGL